MKFFSELMIGDVFYCFGDQLINYDYPKLVKCIKIDDNTAKELELNGIKFSVNSADKIIGYDEDDEYFIEEIKKVIKSYVNWLIAKEKR